MNVFELFAKLTLDSSDYDKSLDDAKKEASELGQTWDKAKGQISKGMGQITTGVGVLAGAGAAAFKAADSASKNLDTIDKMSQKLGMSTQAYQEWDYVLQISGADIQSLGSGLKTLTNKFDDAKSGSEGAVKAFERIGLSMDDIKDMSREDLFSAVIYAFQDMGDTAERAALANELLGRSGTELAPLFNTTSEETKNLIQQVNDLGGVMSEEAVKNGAAFQDSLTSLKTAFSGASNSLMAELVPAITSLMDKIAAFIADGGLDKIIQTMKDLAPVIGLVVAGFAGFKIVSGIVSVIQGVSTAMQALNLVFAANPIGLVVAAVAALIAIFVTLWNNCEEFREFWINLWEDIKAFAVQAWEAIKSAFEAVGTWFKEKFQAAKDGIMEAWSNIKEKFAEKWSQIKEAFSAAKDWFYDKFKTAKEAIMNSWSNIKEKFSEKWSQIKDAFNTTKSWFSEKFTDAKNATVNAWSDISSKMNDVWSRIKEAFRTGEALDWALDLARNFINGITQKLRDMWDMGNRIIDNIWQGIKSLNPFQWGKDLISNFTSGISSAWSTLKSSVSGVAQGIADFLGFSEPDKGPLSNFHTYAPDMMKLFAQGIKDNEQMLQDTVAEAFNFQPTIKAGYDANGYSVNGNGGDGYPSTIIVQSVLDGKIIGETAYDYARNRKRMVGA